MAEMKTGRDQLREAITDQIDADSAEIEVGR